MSQTTAHMHGHHEATMGLAGPSLGRELRARALRTEPHRTGAGVAPPEISVTKSRTDCDLTQQMVGGIKASSPGMKSMSADMFLDLLTMSAPSGEERKLGAAAQVERAGLCLRRFSACTAGRTVRAPLNLKRRRLTEA